MNRAILLPELRSWNDLDLKQIGALTKISGFHSKNILTVLAEVIGFKPWHLHQHYLLRQATPEQITDIVTHIEKLFAKIDLTEFKIRKFRARLKTYHAPADYLKNVTILEFSKADHAFNQYIKTKEMHYLDHLVAVLYRPARNKSERAGDIRVPFMAETLEADTKKIRRVPSKIKHAILLSFWGCRNHLVERFPGVFYSEPKQQDQQYGWAGLLLELSGGKFGDLDKTCDANLYTVLMYLDMKMKAA